METDEKKCPACAELVKAEAVICKHCGLNFATGKLPGQAAAPVNTKPTGPSAGKVLGIIALVIVGIIILGAVAGGERSSTTSSAGAAAVSPARYTEHKQDVYYYTGSVSENDKAEGRAAADVVGFRYLGKDAEGDHKLISADGELAATCGEPCTIIHLNGGETMAFAEDSIIGAAFSDAINGHLTPMGTPASPAQ